MPCQGSSPRGPALQPPRALLKQHPARSSNMEIEVFRFKQHLGLETKLEILRAQMPDAWALLSLRRLAREPSTTPKEVEGQQRSWCGSGGHWTPLQTPQSHAEPVGTFRNVSKEVKTPGLQVATAFISQRPWGGVGGRDGVLKGLGPK